MSENEPKYIEVEHYSDEVLVAKYRYETQRMRRIFITSFICDLVKGDRDIFMIKSPQEWKSTFLTFKTGVDILVYTITNDFDRVSIKLPSGRTYFVSSPYQIGEYTVIGTPTDDLARHYLCTHPEKGRVECYKPKFVEDKMMTLAEFEQLQKQGI